MKTTMIIPISAAVLATSLFASQVWAQAEAADEKFKNGVPFKQLSEEIDANATAIDSLRTSTATLRSDLNTLTANFEALELRVATNETSIAGLKVNISDLDSRIQDNLNQIVELNTDVDANADAIAALKTQVESDLASLGATFEQLRTEIDVEKAELDNFISQVEAAQASTVAQLAAINSEIDNIYLELDKKADVTLVEQVIANLNINQLQQQVYSLQSNLNATKDRLERAINRFCSHTHYYSAVSSHYHHYYDSYNALGGGDYRNTYSTWVGMSGYTDSPSTYNWYGSCYY